MTFKNLDELKKHIMLKSKDAISLMQERVYLVISRFLKEHYAEYSPDMYERTYQLFRSLVKTNIEQTKNGYKAKVYFDLDELDYSMKKLNGKTYKNTFHKQPWTHDNDAWVLDNAMMGEYSHGGYEGAGHGTAIWNEWIFLTEQKYEIFKKALIDAGIPVK